LENILAPDESMDKILENLFFAATEPLTIRQLSQFLQLDSPEEIEGLKTSLERLSKEYQNRGLQLLEVAGGYQLATQADYAKWIRLLRKTVPTPLTEEASVSRHYRVQTTDHPFRNRRASRSRLRERVKHALR